MRRKRENSPVNSQHFEYRFEGCLLNSATRELRVHDEPQQTAPRVLDLLICLIENRSRVVKKQELMDLLWKGAVLSNGVLAQAVRKARFATGDLDQQPRLIKTVHRVGYRFIGEVQSKPVLQRAERPQAVHKPDPGTALLRRPDAGLAGKGLDVRPGGRIGPQWLAGSVVPAVSLARLRAKPTASMSIFALDDEIALWESALPAMHGVERLEVLLPLAWHLRQRDSRRAVSLADEADALLGALAVPAARSARARLALVRGEAKWLVGELDAAGDLAKQAITVLWGLAGDATRCDANIQLAMIATDQGRRAQSQAHLEEALAAANASDDEERATVVKLSMAIAAVLASPAEGAAAWQAWARIRPSGEHLGIVALRERFEVVMSAILTGDSARCLAHCFSGIEAARATGQRREVITHMTNSASRLCLLGDVEAAFEWQESALQMARAAGWPLLIVFALQEGAHLLKAVDRVDEAAEFLDESLELLGKFPRSRSFCATLYYLGFLRFDRKQYALALESFEQLLTAATALDSPHWIGEGADGRARALAALGRTDEALSVELAALEKATAEGNAARLPYVLEALAEIYGYPGVPAPEGIPEGSAKLHFLLRAVAAHESLRKHTVRGGLWQLLADEYARLGDYERAYAMQCKVAVASDATRTTEVTNRAVAMKVRYDTERARAESDHHRALAAAQAERAEALARTNAILDRLGFIGQEIAKQRGVAAVFETLERHAHELLDTSTLAVFVLDERGSSLDLVFGLESAKPLPPVSVAVDSAESNVARCWRDQREILADAGVGDSCRHTPGTLQTVSALYAPLVVGTQRLGVLTIQSVRPGVYGERERLVFRTLAAYGAIALDHAAAYLRLETLLESRQFGGAEALTPARHSGEPPH